MIPRGYCCFGAQALANNTGGLGLLGSSLSSQNGGHVSQPQDGKLGENRT